MFLSQPPATKVTLGFSGRIYYSELEDRRGLPAWSHGAVSRPIIENGDGVTVDEVVSMALSEISQHQDCFFDFIRFEGGVAVSEEQMGFVYAHGGVN